MSARLPGVGAHSGTRGTLRIADESAPTPAYGAIRLVEAMAAAAEGGR